MGRTKQLKHMFKVYNHHASPAPVEKFYAGLTKPRRSARRAP
jgi:hypothetical protein